MSKSLHAANVLVSVVGTATADTVTGGLSSAIGGLLSLKEVALTLGRNRTDWSGSIAAQLDTAFAQAHLSDTEMLHIRQMIEQAQRLSPAEVMAAGRNPERLCALMLRGLHDPALTGIAIQARFTEIVAPLLRAVMARPEVMAALQPAFEEAVIQDLQEVKAQVGILVERAQADPSAPHLAESLLITLAYEFAGKRNATVDDAYRDLRGALEAAKRIIDRGAMPSNLDDAVKQVLAEVSRRVQAQDFDGAAEIAAQERSRLLDEIAERQQAVTTLLDTEIDLARSRNRPEDAATHLLTRLRLEPGDLFEALRAEQDVWFERGRDKGLSFDLEVAIRLARETVARASNAHQRGAALNDLGIALWILGSRETGPERLTEAVAAYRLALDETPREVVPLNWASAQNNLGAALQELGLRETGTERLTEAVAAYRLALEERRREVVPLDWAMTQNNLGNALSLLGERKSCTERLTEAVVAYRLALEERRREVMPLDWAMTQNNLGTALQELGKRETGTERLTEAVAAFRLALEEWDREKARFYWAGTQNNLGNALALLAARENDPARFAEALAAFELALQERRREVVPLDWAMTLENTARTELALFALTADPTLPPQALERLLHAREVFEKASPYALARCDAAIALARSLLP